MEKKHDFEGRFDDVLDFIKQEQSSLLAAILERKFIPDFGRAYVTVPEIMEVAAEFGIIPVQDTVQDGVQDGLSAREDGE